MEVFTDRGAGLAHPAGSGDPDPPGRRLVVARGVSEQPPLGFLEIVGQAKLYLREHRRVSLRALALEFDLSDELLEALVQELSEIQGLAVREGRILIWTGEQEPSETPPEPPSRTPEPERRQLTVLFCDLADSTRLAAEVDPEDWRDVVRAYQDCAARVVGSFDGHVAQYLGDGVLVYFGYPQAHEDDPERAVRAGLELVEALPSLNQRLQRQGASELKVRVGIHTGPVVVGEMGAGATRETLATGDTTNLASRLQEQAGRNCVAISYATLRLIEGIFVTEPLGDRMLKGFRDPVAVHRVLRASGLRSLLDVTPDLLTPFVGREHELRLLLESWDRTLEEEGQAVLITGEAGVGKSRLVLALRERLSTVRHTWLECRSSPFTQGSAFRPVVGLLEHGLGIESDDGAQARLDRVEEGVLHAGLDVGRTAPYLAELLGVPAPKGEDGTPPELRRERTLEALVSWLLALGEIQPVVLLTEDLHWCDPSSLELLGRLMEQLPTSRVMLVMTTRPEFRAPWDDDKTRTPVNLARLRRRDARELVLAVTCGDPLPEEAVSTILDRADGIALYLEELSQAALESGQQGAPVTIPSSLQDSLMARLDRLSSAKEVAHLGSVLGREFSYPLIAAVSELDEAVLRHGLDRLVSARVLFRRGVPPDASYTFKHSLIQQTAYDSLLRRRRQQLHERVARTLLERFPERAHNEPEELARHHTGAEQWADAVSCYERAGAQSTLRSAYAEAVAHLECGIQLLDQMPAGLDRSRRELALRIALGPPLIGVRGYGHADVERNYVRARELSEAAGEERSLFEAIWGLANYHQARGQLDLAEELGLQLVEMAAKIADPQLVSWAHLQYGATRFWKGEYAPSLEELERAIVSYDPDQYRFLPGGPDPCVAARVYAAICLWQLGRSGEALETSRAGIQQARALQHAFSLGIALCFTGSLHQLRGDVEAAAAMAEEVIPLATEHGFPLWRGWGGLVRGWSLAHQGRGGEGLEQMQRSLAEIASTRSTLAGPAAMVMLAEAQRVSGLPGAAAATAAGGLALAEREQQRAWDAELLRIRGEALVEDKGAASDDALGCLERALQVARAAHSRPYELRAALGLARLLQTQGRGDEARSILAEALERHPADEEGPERAEAEALLAALA